jgi:hypothetical protein
MITERSLTRRRAIHLNAHLHLLTQMCSRVGLVSTMQCCLDGACGSPCQYCRGRIDLDRSVCSTDCSSAVAQLHTQCECATVAAYANWPDGYQASSVATAFAAQRVVPNVTWRAPGWDCAEGSVHSTRMCPCTHVGFPSVRIEGLFCVASPYV